MISVLFLLSAVLLRLHQAHALAVNMTSTVECGWRKGGPNRLMACESHGGSLINCHNSVKLNEVGVQDLECDAVYVAIGGPADPYLWTIDGTFNQCVCDAWACPGKKQVLAKGGDSAVFTWFGPSKGYCCLCRPG